MHRGSTVIAIKKFWNTAAKTIQQTYFKEYKQTSPMKNPRNKNIFFEAKQISAYNSNITLVTSSITVLKRHIKSSEHKAQR